MSMTLAELEAQTRRLPAEERARLAEALLESLQADSPSEIQAAWDREIETRIVAHERGEGQVYAAEDVFTEARRLSQ